ncbi:hypothetical protein [Mesorhizobium sp. M0276]|nr:hypothetical protein X743_15740 [Mesorhizobium sp. LNHC252B00]
MEAVRVAFAAILGFLTAVSSNSSDSGKAVSRRLATAKELLALRPCA